MDYTRITDRITLAAGEMRATLISISQEVTGHRQMLASGYAPFLSPRTHADLISEAAVLDNLRSIAREMDVPEVEVQAAIQRAMP